MKAQIQDDSPTTVIEDAIVSDAEPDSVVPGDEVTVIDTKRARPGDWSTRRALITGALVGAFFGAVFAGGYAATSAWICTAQLTCGHWAPIAIVWGGIALAITVFGAIAGYMLNKMYKLFRVA